jgi:anthranilate/para-aminobenzoate synthase component I
VTGAPKFRAMEIIDELEPISRGPYTGAIGYLGFNRESQLSITIRTAICRENVAHFHVGAGIVADSNPDAEYEETLAKAQGFLAALNCASRYEGWLPKLEQPAKDETSRESAPKSAPQRGQA